MSKSNLRERKNFSFGFGDDNDDEEENKSDKEDETPVMTLPSKKGKPLVRPQLSLAPGSNGATGDTTE